MISDAIFFLAVKAIFLLLGGIYFIFTLLVLTRVNLMTNTLQTKVSPFLKIFAGVYVAFSFISVLILLKILL